MGQIVLLDGTPIALYVRLYLAPGGSSWRSEARIPSGRWALVVAVGKGWAPLGRGGPSPCGFLAVGVGQIGADRLDGWQAIRLVCKAVASSLGLLAEK
ncbi:hypothetical protein GCM10022235_79860 [Kribbella ginsengisoli]|uniref:Uncharacterized protein n=1 Tax=Kribbella ginsengisoli TaxID=363865 RepID=A0ABP6Z1L0_9ACTN